MVAPVDISAVARVSQVSARRILIVPSGTSVFGDNNSQFAYLVTKYGGKYQRGLNGANSGQQAAPIADKLHTNVTNQRPAIVMVAQASNDFLFGSPSDPEGPGVGMGPSKYYLRQTVEQCLAAGHKVAICSEPYRNPPQTGVNGNVLYWNNTFLPAFVASFDNPDVAYIDTQDAIYNRITGDLLIPAIQTAGTGVNGANNFNVASTAGITRGMYCYTNSGNLLTGTLTRRVTDIQGTTITFSGTISGTLNETVYFYVDVFDNVHPAPVGCDKICDLIDARFEALGWVPTYGSLKPMTSSTASASIDNLFSNATLLNQSGGLATGFATNFAGAAPVVTTHPNFIGNVQRVTLAPNEPAGRYLLTPSCDVTRLRGRWVVFSIKVDYRGFQPTGGIIDARCTFNGNVPALPATFTNETAQPIYFSNISPVDGTYVYHARVKVPANASSFGCNFTNNLAFPAGAQQNATITIGELVFFDDDHPLEDRLPRRPALTYPSYAVPAALSPYDDIYALDVTSGSVSRAWPSASTCANQVKTVYKDDASANTLTITGARAPDASVVLTNQGNHVTAYSDGTSWRVIGSRIG